MAKKLKHRTLADNASRKGTRTDLTVPSFLWWRTEVGLRACNITKYILALLETMNAGAFGSLTFASIGFL